MSSLSNTITKNLNKLVNKLVVSLYVLLVNPKFNQEKISNKKINWFLYLQENQLTV
jgi:hypothetical protein